MSRALESRLTRLEKRQGRRPFPRLIFGIFDKEADEIIGYEGEREGTRLTILRQPREALEALQARAWALVGQSALFMLYDSASAAQDDVPTAPDTPAHEPARNDP